MMAGRPWLVAPVVHRQSQAGADQLREVVVVRRCRVVLIQSLGATWTCGLRMIVGRLRGESVVSRQGPMVAHRPREVAVVQRHRVVLLHPQGEALNPGHRRAVGRLRGVAAVGL